MLNVKKRLTGEQRLAVRMLWAATTEQTYSPEYVSVIFGISRPTVLNICADTPRLGDKFIGDKFICDALRAGWEQDRQRKALPTDDAAWVLALIRASEHVERVLIESTNAMQALLAQTQAQRISA
jgi:hypothetical protein